MATQFTFKLLKKAVSTGGFASILEDVEAVELGEFTENEGNDGEPYYTFNDSIITMKDKTVEEYNVALNTVAQSKVVKVAQGATEGVLVTFKEYVQELMLKKAKAVNADTESVSDETVVDLKSLALKTLSVIALIDSKETRKDRAKKHKETSTYPEEVVKKLLDKENKAYPTKFRAAEYSEYDSSKDFKEVNWNAVFASSLNADATPTKEMVLTVVSQ